MIREVVLIDEEKCDGCGLCVPACEEGAIRIIDGKARLVADNLCDGMGACLGHCPQGAITIEHREADAFDEDAVEVHLKREPEKRQPAAHHQGGCPGSSFRMNVMSQPSHGGDCPSSQFARFGGSQPPDTAASPRASQPSELMHWPVKLRLLPPHAPVLKGAKLLLAADCAPFAHADFHAELLAGHAVVIGCPKFDDLSGYLDKMVEMIRLNDLSEIAVVHMEVPCCTGLLHLALKARELSGKEVPIVDVVVSTRGDILRNQELSAN